ncbi:MAG: glycosyltransferase [Phycisphaeraceae bacterium]|nr:glycosyltransferase [Phycisphaeraceae bacterium]MCB9848673.1 glycosyltransferase [Phycisphaeraceae bacterium]
MIPVLLVGVALGLFSAVAGSFVLVRTRQIIACAPTARQGADLPEPQGGWPSVCIVIPAHNEEGVIGELVASLVAQDYPGELHVVIALDRCTDATEAIVVRESHGSERVEIVRIAECPEGWAGKTNAASAGVRGSKWAPDADVLIFSDADTIWDPACARACVALLKHRGLDLLSLLSTLRFEGSWEVRAQAVASGELVRRHPIDKVNRTDKGNAFANGQFLCFTRAMYERIGGHGAVREDLLEDLAFARAVQRIGKHDGGGPGAWGVFIADGMLRCRMYDSMAQFRTGWKRIYTESSRRSVSRLRKSARRLLAIWLITPMSAFAVAALGLVMLPLGWGVFAAAALAAGLLGAAVWTVAVWRVCAMQSAPVSSVWWWPAGTLIVASILREAARDLERGEPIVWGGKTYLLEAR